MTGHRVKMEWMGKEVVTLRDLWPAEPRAVVIGINPAPVSVEAGHYYQGNLGQALFRRLRGAGMLGLSLRGHEDDQALAAGIGFTDVVKRPTSSADQIGREELLFGKRLLMEALEARKVPLVIFAFKKSATTLLGQFQGNGFLESQALGGTDVFVMPGPYESATTANPTLETLRQYWGKAEARK